MGFAGSGSVLPGKAVLCLAGGPSPAHSDEFPAESRPGLSVLLL